MSVQRCVYLLALICRAGRSWSAAAPSPCSATSLWKPAALHESRSSGFRNQRSRRGKTPRFLRTAKAASWRLWPTTAWRASTATAATWAWTACPPAASGWGSSRPLRGSGTLSVSSRGLGAGSTRRVVQHRRWSPVSDRTPVPVRTRWVMICTGITSVTEVLKDCDAKDSQT